MDNWFPTFRRLGITGPLAPREVSYWPFFTTRSQRASLLRLIAVAIEQNIPLIPLLQNWSRDESGVHRRRLRKLIALLEEGRRLPDALEQVPAILSDKELLAVRFDAQLGTRAAAIRQLLDDAQAYQGQSATRLRRAVLYLFTVVPIALLSVAFTHFNIIPRLERILQDFGVAPSPYPPWLDVALIPLTTPVGLLLVLLAMLTAFVLLTKTGRRLRQSLAGRFFRYARETHAADVIQKLALAIETGRPISGALSTLARYHFDPSTRLKLLYVRNEIEQGAEVWNSLATVRMLTGPEASLLTNATDGKTRGWTLRQLVSAKRRRIRWRLERVGMLAMPVMVVLLGGLVVLQAFALFDPLVRIINANA